MGRLTIGMRQHRGRPRRRRTSSTTCSARCCSPRSEEHGDPHVATVNEHGVSSPATSQGGGGAPIDEVERSRSTRAEVEAERHHGRSVLLGGRIAAKKKRRDHARLAASVRRPRRSGTTSSKKIGTQALPAKFDYRVESINIPDADVAKGDPTENRGDVADGGGHRRLRIVERSEYLRRSRSWIKRRPRHRRVEKIRY